MRYACHVIWSDSDGEFVGLCPSFPSLSFLAETQGEAIDGIKGLVEDVMNDMTNNGEPLPAPAAPQA